ncbi:MAG: methyltransferase domain-containing protein [Candidatus Limnocylindrales bacterium]
MAAERDARLAELYDLDLREEPGDLDLYLALAAREGGPILELAVGTGRVAAALAAAGHEVVGIDHDPAMLARAAGRWQLLEAAGAVAAGGRLDLFGADLLTADLGARFSVAVLALNSLLLLGTYERQAAAVQALARHVRPGGLCVVDAWLPSPDEMAVYDGRVALEWLRVDDGGRHQVAKFASARHDGATATVTLVTWYDRWPLLGGTPDRIGRTDELRLVTAGELTAMARAAGLRVELLAGDYRMEAFGPGAERVVLLGRLV